MSYKSEKFFLLPALAALLFVLSGFTAPVRVIPLYGRPSGENERIVIRKVVSGADTGMLLINTRTFETVLVPSQRVNVGKFYESPDSLADDSPYFRLRRRMMERYDLCPGGVPAYDGPGYMLTCDLCPSSKPLDRDFLNYLAREGISPVYICISGRWIGRHAEDLRWLKELEGVDIVWVNHSLTHYYAPGVPYSRNFMLKPGTDWKMEILGNEEAMLARGLVPSPFFRYPGLVSNRALALEVLRYGLIPLGSNAWMAKEERPQAGSIILLHANGNEPQGLELFRKWQRNTGLKPEKFKY